MSVRNIIVFVLLIAAALASWYLARSNRAADADALPYDPVHRGYYLKSARILGTDEDGSLLYEIEAAHAEQEAKDRIEFTEVRIRYSPDADTVRTRRYARNTWNWIRNATWPRPTNGCRFALVRGVLPQPAC
jgi:lipopolysaccharide export system protein LptC